MSTKIFKIRITSPDEERAELLRTVLRHVFGPKLSLSKARKGTNPKYADRSDVLAYGEIELSDEELHEAAGLAQPTPATRSKKAAPATQETIALAPAPRRRRKI